jgi:hypothetical protein
MSSTKDTDIWSPYLQSKAVSPCPIAGEGLEWIQVHDARPRPSLHCATSTELHRNSLIPPYRHNRFDRNTSKRNEIWDARVTREDQWNTKWTWHQDRRRTSRRRRRSWSAETNRRGVGENEQSRRRHLNQLRGHPKGIRIGVFVQNMLSKLMVEGFDY